MTRRCGPRIPPRLVYIYVRVLASHAMYSSIIA